MLLQTSEVLVNKIGTSFTQRTTIARVQGRIFQRIGPLLVRSGAHENRTRISTLPR